MKILKFGGTSVGSCAAIKQVGCILKDYVEKEPAMAVVVSAMRGVTNMLIQVGTLAASNDEGYKELLRDLEETHFQTVRDLIRVQEQSRVIAKVKMLLNEVEELLHGVFLLKELSPRSLDLLQSFGERLSALIITQYLQQEGIDVKMLDAREVIRTDASFGSAKIDFEYTNQAITEAFNAYKGLYIITGFIASTAKCETTTLGRGGSDYTASVIGAALNAEVIEIWTDVDGVMTADPKEVKTAFSLDIITYEEAMELSHFGAKVIYPPTLQPALKRDIPLRIKNTFHPEFNGTLVSSKSQESQYPVKGISSIKDIAFVSVSGSGMIGVPGVSSRLFGALARKQINVILITQASSEHSICFAVMPEQAALAKEAIEEEFAYEIASEKINRVHIDEHLAIVAIIGENMKSTPGISGTLFTALGVNGINVVAIAQGSSELNVSVVVAQKDLGKALNALHEGFFLSDKVTVNLYMLGVGLIGGTLLDQMRKQLSYLEQEHALKLNVVAMANTKKMVFDANGLDISQTKVDLLEDGALSDLNHFVERMKEMNLPNSVLVDCTSSEEAIVHYEEVLQSSISIVTPNKLANSGSYADYQKLQKTAREHGVHFLYETNVGAGLPVISPLQDLKKSGDRILKIEGILSGTLSYIFNTFRPGVKFSEVVREAKAKGYTEPDPRDDLNGMDVARKILILSREAGFELEPADVQVENILPEACINAATVEEFLVELDKANDQFEQMIIEAHEQRQALRFIASLEGNKATVGLRVVDTSHPFYFLSGSDNIIAFTTDRYKECPLVIKGPGAGAEVTAAGVFAEIISIGKYMTSRWR
ncbi:bifunctional aspartate kinase/homoserine dehydrogenase I [Rapidithrix thailandica]|uniref:Bifunctional aspartate kinase/homoserine dehydrogenase I n=1 Tax=Rapidithrix thailandica TaxID=413964 RepID=A0AAW9S9X3_9BACT